ASLLTVPLHNGTVLMPSQSFQGLGCCEWYFAGLRESGGTHRTTEAQYMDGGGRLLLALVVQALEYMRHPITKELVGRLFHGAIQCRAYRHLRQRAQSPDHVRQFRHVFRGRKRVTRVAFN